MDRIKVYISVQMVTVSLGEWWERCREAWAPDSAPNDTFKITLWNSKYHHVCWFQLPQGAKGSSWSLRQTSHVQFRVLLSWVICWCAWTTWASLSSDMVPQGWKPTLVTQASSDSSLWRRGMPTYMGMGDNLYKSKGMVTAPPNVFNNIHKDMQLSSEQWHKLPVSWTRQRLFQLVLTNER